MKKNSMKCLLAICMVGLLVGCGQTNAATENGQTASSETTITEDNIAENESSNASENQEKSGNEESSDNNKAEENGATDATDQNASEDASTKDGKTCPLEDGVYIANFDSDSSMFHINEANEGKGILTVVDGVMTMHISLPSKSVLNLYQGLAEDAMKDGAVLLEPTIDSVTYSDGMTEEVHGFDIPVPVLEEEFDLALIGTKGKWYDHKVVVSNPVAGDDLHGENASKSEASNTNKAQDAKIMDDNIPDGEYTVAITMEGGTGKAKIESPAKMVVKDGKSLVTITWSSPNYDYMLMDDVKYEPINTEGNSVFELPIAVFATPITVIGDTTAMSKPHEVEYTIICTIQ